SRLELPINVVPNLFAERLPDPLRYSAVQLALDQHRVDHVAVIVDCDIALDLDVAGVRINFDKGDVRAEGEGEVRWVEEARSFQASLDSLGKVLAEIGASC